MLAVVSPNVLGSMSTRAVPRSVVGAGDREGCVEVTFGEAVPRDGDAAFVSTERKRAVLLSNGWPT